MKYRVINIENWKANDPNAPDVMNDEVIELKEKEVRRGMDLGGIDPIEEIEEVPTPVVEEVEEEEEPKKNEEGFVCEVCQKVCKNKGGLMAHMRSHSK